MWIVDSVITDVDEVALIRYVNQVEVARWNEHRRKGEMRLFTGWAWFSRRSNLHQQGMKTRSACYRDAYYALVVKQDTPKLPKLVRVA